MDAGKQLLQSATSGDMVSFQRIHLSGVPLDIRGSFNETAVPSHPAAFTYWALRSYIVRRDGIE